MTPHLPRKTLACSLFISLAAVLCGCVNPSTVGPVAKANHDNVKNLNQNIHVLTGLLEKQVDGLLLIDTALQRNRALIAINDYDDGTGSLDTTKFNAELTKAKTNLQALLDQAAEGDRLQLREDFAVQYPFVGDVAAGFIDTAQADALVQSLAATLNLYPDTRRSVRHNLAGKLAVMRRQALAVQTIQGSVAAFNAVVRNQGQEAVESGAAIVQFSESNASFSDFINIVASDAVLTGVAQIVSTHTNDPERKAAALKVLDRMEQSTEQASDSLSN